MTRALLALTNDVRHNDQVRAAAHVDEDWNIGKWGVDEEAVPPGRSISRPSPPSSGSSGRVNETFTAPG